MLMRWSSTLLGSFDRSPFIGVDPRESFDRKDLIGVDPRDLAEAAESFDRKDLNEAVRLFGDFKELNEAVSLFRDFNEAARFVEAGVGSSSRIG